MLPASRSGCWRTRPATPDARGYTIYFINWYGRSDFRFHVYTKTDEPDPDTLYNFGVIRDSRKIISWGGTHSRNWFYDFSAGPEAWGGNYDVDDLDLDGDDPDVLDYRVPPIWEYVRHGYRRPEKLGGDMGLLARFVAIDLLFTTSPLYDPFASAPDAGGRKVAHVAMMEDEVGVSGLDWYHSDFAESAWKHFEPYYRWKVGLTDDDPIDADAKRSLDIFSGALVADDCWNAFGDTFAQLFCYFDANLSRYIPRYGRRDAVGAIFAFNTSSDLGGLLGFADDNWTDGTPTYEFCFDSAPIRELGFGFTTTVIHEFGHHLGMSHPHDGYDSEFDTDFDAVGAFYFAWVGDESDTIMQYIALSNGFGRHNQDNMYRWETAGYLNWANALAGDILASPRADRVMASVMKADGLARQATEAFRDWRYLEAAGAAREAYATLKAAADEHRRLVARARRVAAPGRARHGTEEGGLPASLPDREGGARTQRLTGANGLGGRIGSAGSARLGPRGTCTSGPRPRGRWRSPGRGRGRPPRDRGVRDTPDAGRARCSQCRLRHARVVGGDRQSGREVVAHELLRLGPRPLPARALGPPCGRQHRRAGGHDGEEQDGGQRLPPEAPASFARSLPTWRRASSRRRHHRQGALPFSRAQGHGSAGRVNPLTKKRLTTGEVGRIKLSG